MTTTTNEQITAELHTLNEGINRLTKTIQLAAKALYAGQIIAAEMIAAKNDYDFNTAKSKVREVHDAFIEDYERIYQ